MRLRDFLIALLVVALSAAVSALYPWGWAVKFESETGCKGVTTLDLQPARRAALTV